MSEDLKEVLTYSNSLKVLFAEDNYDVRIQLLKLLENFFSEIDVEIDGEKALNKYNSFQNNNNKHYDLVITDLSMPKIDGVELSKRIIDKNPEQLILVISAHTESEKIKELEKIGVYEFLRKPVDYKLLLNTLISVILKIKENKEEN